MTLLWLNVYDKQECIPVGCVPSAAVAIWGCVYLGECTPVPPREQND